MEQDEENIFKYTNYKSQLWVDYTQEDDVILCGKVRVVTKEKNVDTKVDPFHSFNDLEAILDYFFKNKKYQYWLTGWLMASLGRRVGDTMSLKWSDIYLPSGKYRDRLCTLKEEKTGKITGVRLHDFARAKLSEYCEIMNINPMEHYNDKIIKNGTAAFRTALSNAVSAVGLTYPISTHSFRKFFGNTMYQIHPQDADAIKMIQYMFGHSSDEITKAYIGEVDRKIDTYNTDYSNYLSRLSDGQDYDIDNKPVVVLKTDDMREILIKAIQYEGNELNALKELLLMVDELKVN